MVEWPGNPVATMWMPNYAPQSGGEPAAVRWAEGLSNLQTVVDASLSWSVECTYFDGAWIDHGQGFFRAAVSEWPAAAGRRFRGGYHGA